MNTCEDLRAPFEIGKGRWLVTGAAGYIGSHLAENLLAPDRGRAGNFSTGNVTTSSTSGGGRVALAEVVLHRGLKTSPAFWT